MKQYSKKTLFTKTKVILCDFLFADDPALVAHIAEKLQTLLNQFSSACEALDLLLA